MRRVKLTNNQPFDSNLLWCSSVSIISLVLGLIYYFTRIVKKAVAQPIDKRTKLLLPSVLSEKPRWKWIKEEYGLAIGFWFGVCLMIFLYWSFFSD